MLDVKTLLIAIVAALVIVLPLVGLMHLRKRRNPDATVKVDYASALIDLITRLLTGG